MNEVERDLAAIGRFEAGQIYRHITFSDHYATAEVLEVNRETGRVKLRLMKRSSRNRWNIDIGAAKLLRHLPTVAVVVRLIEAAA